jgi:hypothetical protein
MIMISALTLSVGMASRFDNANVCVMEGATKSPRHSSVENAERFAPQGALARLSQGHAIQMVNDTGQGAQFRRNVVSTKQNDFFKCVY